MNGMIPTTEDEIVGCATVCGCGGCLFVCIAAGLSLVLLTLSYCKII